jgi:hypothetical protein
MISSDPHFYNLRKVFCLAWLLCLSQSLFAEKTELTISENSFFEIIGSDIKSTQVINELSNYVAESVLEEFSEEDYLPSRKILVQLLNDKALPPDMGSYDLSISDLGFVTLNLSWDKSLSLPKTIEALVVSFLQSYGYYNYGDLFLEKYPSNAWIFKGLSNHIYLSFRPSVLRVLYEQAIADGFELDCLGAQILDLNCPTEAQSFWFYRFIESSHVSSKERLKILKYALLGEDTLKSLPDSLRSNTEKSLHDALSTFLNSEYQYNVAQFESLASSKKWLESLGDVSSVKIESIEKKHNSLHLLWVNRENPSLVLFIKARIHLISLALNRINPLYYNAAQSLALTYQKILDGVEEWELLYYFSDFLTELDQANSVSHQIDKQFELKLP